MSQVTLENPNNTKRRNSLIRQTDTTQTNAHQPLSFSHPEDLTNTYLSARYQVLLLDKGESQDVEVQETDQIDFRQVEDYLRHGGSVFITSKRSQKIAPPKENKLQPNKNDAGESTIWFS
jgi:hypothetical protein